MTLSRISNWNRPRTSYLSDSAKRPARSRREQPYGCKRFLGGKRFSKKNTRRFLARRRCSGAVRGACRARPGAKKCERDGKDCGRKNNLHHVETDVCAGRHRIEMTNGSPDAAAGGWRKTWKSLSVSFQRKPRRPLYAYSYGWRGAIANFSNSYLCRKNRQFYGHR